MIIFIFIPLFFKWELYSIFLYLNFLSKNKDIVHCIFLYMYPFLRNILLEN
ncbi:hypothetical protein LEP1GSC112_0063 [Leptospira interrogans serovar Pomona str. UT364]|nr:hypothetical protein LEP1GSC110_1273 [Leptospira interrogans serovar Medanensis str. UT053]EMO01278.1 hypothetical protein LEP1GSC112_0063 [Leptospira interrogans serovar Pomona str. UT364]